MYFLKYWINSLNSTISRVLLTDIIYQCFKFTQTVKDHPNEFPCNSNIHHTYNVGGTIYDRVFVPDVNKISLFEILVALWLAVPRCNACAANSGVESPLSCSSNYLFIFSTSPPFSDHVKSLKWMTLVLTPEEYAKIWQIRLKSTMK